jgi:perosamine synthetase
VYIPEMPGLAPRYVFGAPEATPPPFPLNAPHRTFSYMARNVIYHLFRALKLGPGDVVLMPELHSGVEVWAVRAAGATVRFYPINRHLEPDLDALRRLCASCNARVLYAIHFVGWSQPLKELTVLCREHGMILIEDCALSFLSEQDGKPLGTTGDYAVYCLYKYLPVPHGGLLVQNANVFEDLTELKFKPCTRASMLARSTELFQNWVRGRSDPLGRGLGALKRGVGLTLNAMGNRRLPAGDISPSFSSAGFSVDNMNLGMSPFCHRLLRRFDYEAIRRRRRENFRIVRERLDGKVTMLRELEPGVTPLFFPLLVRDKSASMHLLQQRGVGTIPFWNYGHPEAEASASRDSRFIREHTLELPIHQDLTSAQAKYVADQVLRLNTLI